MKSPIEIFFSYAHEDELLMEDFRVQLVLFERQGLIQKWHDRQIPAASDWKGQIDARLRAARIILLFVSPHFFESDYCYDNEMTEALRRHEIGEARVVPIILRPCLWETSPFSHLQVLPTDGKPITTWQNRDEACLNVAKGIMGVVLEMNDAALLNDQAIAQASQPDPQGTHESRPKRSFSIELAVLNLDSTRQMKFGLAKKYDSEGQPLYLINFVLREQVNGQFQNRVELSVEVGSANNKRAENLMSEGLSVTQLSFLQGPVANRAKKLPLGTQDDQKLIELLRKALRE
jgi:hypothetical protein